MNVDKTAYIPQVTPASNAERAKPVLSYTEDSTKENNKFQSFPKENKDINLINSDLLKKYSTTDKPKEISPTEKENKTDNITELTEEEQKQVDKLKQIDREVRTHEQAHVSAGGGLVKGGINFSYQTGPDNKKYAVAGKVNIDIAPEKGNPEATIRKMQIVKRAALAPSDPSPQDRAIATTANQIESKARAALRQQKSETNNSITKKISDKLSSDLLAKYSSNQQEADNYSNVAITQGTLNILI